jgi:hypothetical protein
MMPNPFEDFIVEEFNIKREDIHTHTSIPSGSTIVHSTVSVKGSVLFEMEFSMMYRKLDDRTKDHIREKVYGTPIYKLYLLGL